MRTEKYKNFEVATYIYAYYLKDATDEMIQEGIDYFKSCLHLDKIYIENHRGKVDIPVERLKEVKALFEKNGIRTASGITATQWVNQTRKPALFDTFCYTDPAHREKFLQVVRDLAGIFDEIILDDFFFTSCRCEMCIQAKGKLSWKNYRLNLMKEFAQVIVDEAHRINPNLKFVIKYPNWYESYQECGFNPAEEKDIFDGIYSGTETRHFYSPQHLQRYLSYSIIRLLENAAPGRNGGGWVDLGGSQANMNNLLEQFEFTLMGHTPEVTVWNFTTYNQSTELPSLGRYLDIIDNCLSLHGNPIGVSAYEPFNGDGEDQLYNYLGMMGTAVEPTPYFKEDAPTILFTESSAEDPDVVEKLEAYVRNGGNAVVTTGFFRATYDKGIKDLTSARLTSRHVIGNEYLVNNANYMSMEFSKSVDPVMIEIVDYKTNASQADISLMVKEDNFPIMVEDNYGKGRFFLLNMPENFADFYNLTKDVVRAINKHLSMGQKVFIACDPKYSFFAYDNNVYAVHSFHEVADKVEVIVRGECNGIRDLETGKEYTVKIPRPTPDHRGDGTTVIDEPHEFSFIMPVTPGKTVHFEVI